MSLPCSSLDLIPQKGKMGFEQVLIKPHNNNSESLITIHKDNIFLDDNNQLSNSALVEFINQLKAASQGYNFNAINQEATKGLFVGLEEASFLKPVYYGDELTLKCNIIDEVYQVSFIRGTIYRNQELVAELTTKLFEVTDLPTLNVESKPDLKVSFDLKKELPDYLNSNLLRQLYTYTDNIVSTDDSISFSIACPVEFDPFDGHFPGNPILPGVVWLEIIQLAIRLFTKKAVILKSVNRMKISGVVHPCQKVTCVVKVEEQSNSKINFVAVFNDENNRVISKIDGYCLKEKNDGK
jgi:3-hydroxymyristoyl/3-hydroxydecanoyl-(acyl carrier protein) dehydratase